MQLFKKGGKIFENLGKNVQNLTNFLKSAGDCDNILYYMSKCSLIATQHTYKLYDITMVNN